MLVPCSHSSCCVKKISLESGRVIRRTTRLNCKVGLFESTAVTGACTGRPSLNVSDRQSNGFLPNAFIGMSCQVGIVCHALKQPDHCKMIFNLQKQRSSATYDL